MEEEKIPSYELANFTTPGAKDAASRTYDSIKHALSHSPELQNLEYDVFLQGSYANATNIRGDSDVDIVVMLKSTFIPDTSALTPVEKSRHESERTPGSTTPDEFRKSVTSALRSHYGLNRVHGKNKCIRVDKTDGYVDADVVPALESKLYLNYPNYYDAKYIEGISIKPLSGASITNYPKEHLKNGRTKNSNCDELYKSTVRQIKRIRRRAVAQHLLEPGLASGYLLECLTYNVPDSYFLADDVDRVRKVLAWLQSKSAAELASGFVSCDEIHHLFIDDPGRHNKDTAKKIIQILYRIV